MPTRQQQRSEASREALIRAAISQFYARGYAATSVDDIVRDTDYSRGSFYFHFTNKLHCFLEVIAYRQALRGDWARLPADRDPSTTSLEALLRETVRSLFTSLDGQDRWVLLMVECYQQHRHDEQARQRLQAVYTSWLAEIATFVRGLQEGGWVDPAPEAELLTARLFAFMEGLYAHASLYALGGYSLDEAMFGGLLALLPPPPSDSPEG